MDTTNYRVKRFADYIPVSDEMTDDYNAFLSCLLLYARIKLRWNQTYLHWMRYPQKGKRAKRIKAIISPVIEHAILYGDGSRQPIGILEAGCLIGTRR